MPAVETQRNRIIIIPAFRFRAPKNTGVQSVFNAMCKDQKATAKVFSGKDATRAPANAKAI